MFNLKVGGIAAIAAFLLSFIIGLISRTAMPILVIRPLIFAVVFFALSGLLYFLINRFLPELLSEGGADSGSEFLPGSRINITEDDSYADDYAKGAFSGAAPSSNGQVFMGAQADDSGEELGNISDLHRKAAGLRASPAASHDAESAGTEGMDQNTRNGYNGGGQLEELPEPDAFMPWEPLPLSGGGSPQPANSGPSTKAEDSASLEPVASVAARPVLPGVVAEGVSGTPGSVDFFPDLDSMAGAFLPGATSVDDTIEYSVSTPAPKRSRSDKTPALAGDFNAKEIASGLRTVLNKDKEG